MSTSLKILAGVGIVLFWGTMTGWLVRANWNDGNAPFSEIPARLVLAQILKHEVSSQLGIYKGRQRIGAVTITPINSPRYSVSFDGNILTPQENGRAQLMNFSIHVDLASTDFRPDEVGVRLRRREPSLNATVDILIKEKKVRYEIKNGNVDMGMQEIPLSEQALMMAGPMAGLPPLPMDSTGFLRTLAAEANRATFKIRGERMDGFRAKLSAAGLTATATLGQLGELFMLRTSTEYQFLADGLEPEEYFR